MDWICVGIGALSHRYDSKEELLRTLCANEQVYVAEIEKALASDGEPWAVFTAYLRRIVAANTHGLTVRLAGLFTPSAEQLEVAERMRALSIELFERVRATGELRADVTYLDIEYLLEFLASVRLGDARRSAELRQRHLAVIIDGLQQPAHAATRAPPNLGRADRALDHPLTIRFS